MASCYRNWDKLCPDGPQLACIQTLLLPLPVPLGSGKNFKPHPLKGLFKISNEQLRLLYMGVNEFFLIHVHCHANQTHFNREGYAPGLVFKFREPLLRTLVISFAGGKDTRPLGM